MSCIDLVEAKSRTFNELTSTGNLVLTSKNRRLTSNIALKPVVQHQIAGSSRQKVPTFLRVHEREKKKKHSIEGGKAYEDALNRTANKSCPAQWVKLDVKDEKCKMCLAFSWRNVLL